MDSEVFGQRQCDIGFCLHHPAQQSLIWDEGTVQNIQLIKDFAYYSADTLFSKLSSHICLLSVLLSSVEQSVPVACRALQDSVGM